MSKAWNKDMDKCHGNTDTNVVGFYLLLDMSKEQNGDTETNVIDSWDFIYYWRYPKYKMILFFHHSLLNPVVIIKMCKYM
jgi:hypothetical protein